MSELSRKNTTELLNRCFFNHDLASEIKRAPKYNVQSEKRALRNVCAQNSVRSEKLAIRKACAQKSVHSEKHALRNTCAQKSMRSENHALTKACA